MELIPVKIWELMKNESPVFIVGAPRSGTSILYRILQKHSSFRLQDYDGKSGVNLVESNIFQNPYDYTSQAAIDYLLGNRDIYDRFLESTQALRKYQSLVFARAIENKLYRKENLTFIRLFFWRFTLTNILVSTFFYWAKKARKCKRILEKTPQSIFHLPEIKNTFPRSKLLFIYRHPIDVFSSYKKRLKKSIDLNSKKSELRWLKIEPDRFCKMYQQSIDIALKESADRPEQLLPIMYEELVNYPENTIQKICKFLDESYEENCLIQDETNLAKFEVDPYLFGKIKKVTKDWSDFVSETDARYIEDGLQAVMNRLGYSRYSDPLAKTEDR